MTEKAQTKKEREMFKKLWAKINAFFSGDQAIRCLRKTVAAKIKALKAQKVLGRGKEVLAEGLYAFLTQNEMGLLIVKGGAPVGGLEFLNYARQQLRQRLGQWNDELKSQWMSGNELICEYKGPQFMGVDVSLRVNFDSADLPDGLLKPGCEIVEESVVKKQVVCEVV